MRTPRTSPARVLLLALVLGAPALAMPREAQGEAPKADPKKPAPRETLQQFLERLRGLRDGVQTQLAGSVADALRVLEMEAQVRRLPGCEDQKERLVALGAEAAPLLVDRIDPGANGTDAQKLVAQYVAQALAGIPTPSITDKLLAVLKDGSLEGRRNALRVLAVTPEPARVVPLLAQFFQQAQGQVRKDALAALVRIGGKDSEKVLGDALADPNPEIVRTALAALAETKAASHAPRVQRLLGSTKDAVQYLDGLLAYFRACPDAVEKPAITGFLRVAEDVAAPREARIKILEALAVFGERFDTELRKEARVLSAAPEREIKEAALVLLHLVGDKSAKRELLADYDDQIDRNKGWANSWEQRAAILYRIGEYKDAQRDYLQAINLAKNDIRARLDDAYIGLARCYAQQNKLKDAASTLERAPVSLKQLSELAKEPVFQKMVENPKYCGVFKLD
ncbi:MAG: HEAT repeat domain-containing protein [Planctomycetes bacterium]|nr:HEAT repeat domain-containing protein [Planctomycetota bacterium]